jgi:3-phenylpropionate/trans-cinnamate dioxygenase ferredoxin reductase subunit
MATQILPRQKEGMPMVDFKYVIVGGGLAAARACEGIRELDSEGSIAVLAAEGHLPYVRPPLSKAYLRGKRPRAKLFAHDEVWYRDRNVTVMMGAEATRITRRSRRVTVADGDSVGYEELLLATGGRAWRLPLSGADLPGVCTLRTMDDCDAIRAAARKSTQVLVVGGSFIGCEVTASFTQMGVPVTMCFMEEYPLQAVVPPELGRLVQSLLETGGARVIPATRPERIEGSGRAERVQLEHGHLVETDLVIMGVGIRLNTQLARDAELDLTELSGVVVDEHLRTSDPHIYAAGDIAAWPDPISGQRARVEHWDVARTQGLCAGRNMAGAGEVYRILPYFFSDILDLSFEAWGSLAKADRILVRGSLANRSGAYWYVRGGRLAGVLAIGRPEVERDAMQSLVTLGPAAEALEGALMDTSVDLALLV